MSVLTNLNHLLKHYTCWAFCQNFHLQKLFATYSNVVLEKEKSKSMHHFVANVVLEGKFSLTTSNKKNIICPHSLASAAFLIPNFFQLS